MRITDPLYTWLLILPFSHLRSDGNTPAAPSDLTKQGSLFLPPLVLVIPFSATVSKAAEATTSPAGSRTRSLPSLFPQPGCLYHTDGRKRSRAGFHPSEVAPTQNYLLIAVLLRLSTFFKQAPPL
jgi:hypothetical protein